MTYKEKLLDPRWQKMRLKVLERDEFTCQSCGEENNTLHIHHKLYRHNASPWEYEIGELITLCANCHELETSYMKDSLPAYMEILKTTFLPSEIVNIISSICIGYTCCTLPPDAFIGILNFYFDYPKGDRIMALFENMIKEKKKIKKTRVKK